MLQCSWHDIHYDAEEQEKKSVYLLNHHNRSKLGHYNIEQILIFNTDGL